MNFFAYGTLMAADIMVRVSGATCSSCRATLNDFVRKQVRGEVYPAITKQDGASVDGVLFFDLPSSAFDRLDRFEGSLYVRTEVDAACDDGRIVAAQTYTIATPYRERLSAEDWSYEEFLQDHKRAFVRDYAGYQVLD
jgi:gamma-glutamylcyclotransferase (GGCT)/AIG2-like uncharacterized protein YtfP